MSLPPIPSQGRHRVRGEALIGRGGVGRPPRRRRAQPVAPGPIQLGGIALAGRSLLLDERLPGAEVISGSGQLTYHGVMTVGSVETVGDLERLMTQVRALNRDAVAKLLQRLPVPESWTAKLQEVAAELDRVDKEKPAGLEDVRYERNEVHKDLALLRGDFAGLRAHLNEVHARKRGDFKGLISQLVEFHSWKRRNFAREVARVKGLLRRAMAHSDLVVASDRDGTLSNYCARYDTSVQPIWNALALSVFSMLPQVRRFVEVTSAPLDQPEGFGNGLLDLTTSIVGPIALAGSSGRHYFGGVDEAGALPLSPTLQRRFTRLQEAAIALIERYPTFRKIGSGFQIKYDQICIGIQNQARSVPVGEAEEFQRALSEMVDELNAAEGAEVFHLGLIDHDSNAEIKIDDDPAEGQAQPAGSYGKRQGFNYLYEVLALATRAPKGSGRPNFLLCGDTPGDIGLIEGALDRRAPENVFGIFVTKDRSLRARVKALLPKGNVAFVSNPDALVMAFLELALEELTRARPEPVEVV